MMRWKVLEVEKELNLSSIKDNEFHRNIPGWFWRSMGGKLDGVVENEAGDLYVLEHKSRSRLDTLSSASLALDQQANWYMAAYSLMTGRPIRGFLYNVIQKPLHKMSIKGSNDLKSRMVAAMLDAPEKYFSLVDVIADQTDIQNNLNNMLNWVTRMKSASLNTITRNTSQCDQYGGCSYRPLCQHGFTVDKVHKIGLNPELVLYDIARVNDELAEGTEEE